MPLSPATEAEVYGARRVAGSLTSGFLIGIWVMDAVNT